MPKVIKVTPVQVSAAKLKIKRSIASGKSVPVAVQRIADAKPAVGYPVQPSAAK